MPRNYYSQTSYDDDLFDAEEAAARRRKREELLAANAEIAAAEAREEATRRRLIAERAIEANRRQVLREYEAAGVEPLAVDASGAPTTSLSLLLSLGWTVERIGDRNVLARSVGLDRGGDA